MKLIFAGTPEFAARALEALLSAGHEVALVLTQPDRPAGRGLKAAASPVKQIARARGIPVEQPVRLKDPASHGSLIAARSDLMVVAAYGLILPQAVLDIPRHGCLNIHASLLPRWRGAAPIQRAILAGDRETGITIMRMDAGLDTGPMLLAGATPIGPEDTAGTLHDRLAAMGGKLIVDALARLERGDLAETPQPAEGATYAPKLDRAEAAIDWTRDASALDRAVRAFSPVPGVSANFRGTPLKIWRVRPGPGRGAPGSVLAAGPGGVHVACGEGALILLELQKPGGKRLPAAEFLRGFPLAPGDRFGA